MFRDQKHSVYIRLRFTCVNVCALDDDHQQKQFTYIASTHLRASFWLFHISFLFLFFLYFSCRCRCRFFLFNVFFSAQRAHTQHVWVCIETYNKTCIFLPKVNTYYITYNIYSTRNRKWVHDVGHLQRSFVCVIFLLLLFPYSVVYFFLHARIRFVLVFFLNTNLYNWCIKANNLTILYAFTAETKWTMIE